MCAKSEVKQTAENDVVCENYYLKYGMLSANGSHGENSKLKIKYFIKGIKAEGCE